MVVTHFETLTTLKTQQDERASYFPCHKSWLVIVDKSMSFSSLCVSQDVLPKHFTQAFRCFKTFESQPLKTCTHVRLLFERPTFGVCDGGVNPSRVATDKMYHFLGAYSEKQSITLFSYY